MLQANGINVILSAIHIILIQAFGEKPLPQNLSSSVTENGIEIFQIMLYTQVFAEFTRFLPVTLKNT